MAGITRRNFAKMLAGAVVLPVLAPVMSRSALAAAKEFKVALLLPGTISDGGWNSLAYHGLQSLKKSGIKVAWSESVPQAQMEQSIRGYADDGYNLIIGHSFEYGAAFTEIAPDYPDTDFFASTFKPAEAAPKNVEYINLAYIQAAYAAGALAALISDKGKAVGFVGGGDNPTQQGMMRAFILGAEKTRSGIKGLGVVTGDYGNAAKGREAATAMITNGADVIWHAADVTGLGALQGAIAANVKAIGCYTDQKAVSPAHIACSFKQNVDWVVEQVGSAAAGHAFKGGEEWAPSVAKAWSVIYGDASHNASLVSDSAWQAFQKIWQQLDTGALSATA